MRLVPILLILCPLLVAPARPSLSSMAPRSGMAERLGEIGDRAYRTVSPPKSTSWQNQRSTISGTVVNESGQPLVNAAVYLWPAGSGSSNTKTEWTDDDGKFQFSALTTGVYSVSCQVAAYYPDTAGDQPTYVRTGESIKIRMIRGGVISGKVTNMSGQPLIAGTMNAARLRDPEGKVAPHDQGWRQFLTDDRGVYRVYGLPPGSYVVSVGGGNGRGYAPQAKPYDLMSRTYYPSSTRDTASEVLVTAGQETSGIDIRFREEAGYRVSGTVSGVPAASGPFNSGVGINLTSVKSGSLESSTYVQGNDPAKGFVFNGVADGEYDVMALRMSGRDDGLASAPRRITVKGADVTGVQLAVAPLGKISGQITLEPVPEGLKKDEGGGPDMPLAETLITARRDGKPDPSLASSMATGTPDEKSKFVLANLASGTYHIELGLPSEDWYVREMLSSPKGNSAPPQPKGRPAARSSGPDIAARGVSLKSGDHIEGVSITISRGAAFVAGTVTPVVDGGTLPARIRLCLVPAEPERASDVVYYKQVAIGGDGKFVIANIAPGKYRAVTVPGPVDEASEPRGSQIAWNPTERKSLRQRAESEGLELELGPRQRIKDFVLKYKPPSEGAQRSMM